jgi:hypothetical protein
VMKSKLNLVQNDDETDYWGFQACMEWICGQLWVGYFETLLVTETWRVNDRRHMIELYITITVLIVD